MMSLRLRVAALLILCVCVDVLTLGSLRTEEIADVYFFDGTGCCVTGEELIECSPACRTEDGEWTVPLEAAVTSLGGRVTGKRIRLGGRETALSDIEYTLSDGVMTVTAGELCEKLDLSYRDYGQLLQIGDSCEHTEYSERMSFLETAGCAAAYEEETDPIPERVVDPYQTESYELMLEQISMLEQQYPGLISVFSIGTTMEGRDIPAFTFGRGERVIFYGASIHAGEHVTTNVIMDMVDRYAYGYYADEQEEGYISYRELLDNVTFYIIPMINPDGVNIAQNGYGASTQNVKRYDKQGVTWYGAYKANANGIDLNRNFPYKWNPENENGIKHRSMRYFCGFEAASEPEVQGVIQLGANIPWEMFADFHKFGEELFWVDTDSEDHIERYGYIAQRIAEDARYELHHVESVVGFGGYCSNYMRNVYDRFSLTVETCMYWQYGARDFDKVAANVWRIGLVMGEELLKLEDEVEGLRVIVNGRTVPVIEDCAMTDSYISMTQFEGALTAAGASCCSQNGLVQVTFNGKTATCEAVTGSVPEGDGDLYVECDGKYFNATDILSLVGIYARKSGATAYFTF